MNIQCTKNLLKRLDRKILDVASCVQDDLNTYHANIFKVGIRNTLLLTHNTSLYSFWIYGILADDLQDIEEFIRQSVFQILANSGYTQQEWEKILLTMDDIYFSTANNKSVISTMNRIQQEIKMMYKRDIGYDIYQINSIINDTPLGSRDYKSPKQLFAPLIKAF